MIQSKQMGNEIKIEIESTSSGTEVRILKKNQRIDLTLEEVEFLSEHITRLVSEAIFDIDCTRAIWNGH